MSPKYQKIDFKKTLKHLYGGKKDLFDVVEMPVLQYLKVTGQGSPEGLKFKQALETLYPIAYKLKFFSKITLERDYVVPPLEGLWWADDMDAFKTRDLEQWKWCLMIMVPDWITQEHFNQAVIDASKKGKLPAQDQLHLEHYDEGRVIQTLHIGSYQDEAPILEKMHRHIIPEQGLKMRGHHHEIYFNDPRRTAPEKLRTLLRQPVGKI